MTSLPTPEESARLVLAIFRHHNIPPGRFLEAGALNSQFIDIDGSAADYETGVRFAIDHGWVELEPPVVRLKPPGFAQM
jgi:hypothetical protein